MKKTTLLKLSLSALFVSPALADFTWTNALNDNNFANLGNWSGDPTDPTSFEMGNDNWDVNLLGDDRAVVSSPVRVERDVRIGDTDGQGELLITTGGHLTVTRNFRTARSGDGVTGFGIVTIDGGGQLTTENNLFIGQSLNEANTFNLINGTVTVEVNLAVAHQAQTYSTVNIFSDGEMIATNRARFSDGGSDESTSFLNISGNGILNVTGMEDDEGNIRGGDLSFAHNDGVATSHVTISDNAFVTGGSVRFGDGIQSLATLTMSGGMILARNNVRVAFGLESEVEFDISGGTLDGSAGFMTIAQERSDAVVTMTGGTILADRLAFANDEGATSTLNMTGGVIRVARSGNSDATTTGAFRMGEGASMLNIGGDALIDTEKLWITQGGLLTLSDNARIDIKGASDADNPTFDFAGAFAEGDWSSVLGKIAFNGGTVVVAGATNSFQLSDGAEEPTFTPVTVNYVELLNAAIAQGVIYTDVPEGSLEARYDAGADVTEVVLVLPLQPPSSPSGLAVAPQSADSLSVSWNASTGEVDAYRVERRPEGASDWTPVAETTELALVDTGLAADTVYDYRVQAFNEAGPSDWSPIASGRTLVGEPPVFTIPNEWVSDPELGELLGYEDVNWAYSELIGFIEFSSFPWIYHVPAGWAYFAGRSPDDSVLIFYFYDDLGWAFAFEGYPGLLYIVDTEEFIEL